MAVQILTQDEINGLDIVISNGAVQSASINIPDPELDVNMVCLGDSNTLTFTSWFPQADRFSNLLNGAINGSSVINTINSGVSGEGTAQVLNRLQSDVFAHKDIAKRNVVSLLIGTNDFQLGVSTTTAIYNLTSIINQIIAEGWELIILTYPPTVGETAKNIQIEDLNQFIRDNEHLGYTAIDAYNQFILSADIVKPGLMMTDGLHFNQNGHLQIYSLILDNMFNIGIIDYSTTPTATYATWNSSDKSAEIILSNGDLTATISGTGWDGVRSTISKTSGKWYWEIKVDSGGFETISGIGNSSATLTFYLGSDVNGWGYYGTTGSKTNNGLSAYGATYTTGDVIGIALDMDTGTIEFFKNNVSQTIAFASITGTIYAMISLLASSPTVVTANFGATTMTYTAPSGFNQGLYN